MSQDGRTAHRATRALVVGLAAAAAVSCDDLPDPPGFGPGFADLSAGLNAAKPFGFSPDFSARNLPEVSTAIFADLDGDGRQELLVAKESMNRSSQQTHVFRFGADGAIERHPGYPEAFPFEVVAALDLDGDGLPDLLTSNYARAVAWGRKGGGFDPPEPLGDLPQERNALGTWLDDLDDDGWLDVLQGVNGQRPTDCAGCGALVPKLRTGLRRFEPFALIDEGRPTALFQVWSGRFSPGERVIASIGWGLGATDAPFFYHHVGEDDAGRPRFAAFNPVPKDAAFLDPDRPADVSFFSPMGLTMGDLDGDGLLDAAIAGSSATITLKGRPAWPFEDVSEATGHLHLESARGRDMIPWSFAFLDLDRDTRPDVVITHGDDFNDAYFDADKAIGPERNVVRWNAGGLRFVDVTDALHLGEPGQQRSLAVTDLEGDGDADLAVGGPLQLPRVYRNDIVTGNLGFALRLRGTTSNHLGIGARVGVTAVAGGHEQLETVGGMAATRILSEPLVFPGLGRAGAAALVRVTWPSGTIQEVRDVAAGRLHTIEEPPVLVVLPASRHVVADGAATATLRITPRRVDGSIRADARVEARLKNGEGRLSAPVRDGEGWLVTLTAPTAPGSSRVEVSIDGVAIKIRPRLFWDAR